MNNFLFENKTRFLFGGGCVKEYLASFLTGYGPSVLLVREEGDSRSGAVDEVRDILRRSGKQVAECAVGPFCPRYEQVRQAARLCRERRVDLMLGVGGSAVLDPDYTMSLPRMQVLSGAFDTLSHAMETYFGRSDRDNVSDEVALAVMHSTVVNMRTLLKDINDYTARSNLMWTSAMAENGILKVGRVTDFECHQMEHQLGAYTDCNHGQGLAVLHPAYYRHIVKDAPEKFARLGQAVFGVEGAEAAVDALAAFIRECGLPTRLGQLKSKVEITPELLRQVADSVNLLPNGPRQLTHDEVYEILKECL